MEQNFLVDQFFKGGPMMWPMLLCSLIALGVIIDRLYNLMRVPGEEEAEQQLNAAEDVLKSQGEGGAVTLKPHAPDVTGIPAATLPHPKP